MHFMRRLKIKNKLLVMNMMSTAAALVVACAVLAAWDYRSFRKAFISELMTLGDIVGANCAAAVSFKDATGATETLASLAAQPEIEAAAVYDANNKLLASYLHDNDEVNLQTPNALAPGKPRFVRDDLELVTPIRVNGTVVGHIYLRRSVDALTDRLVSYGLGFGVVLGTAGIVAFALIKRLQRHIVTPIEHLSEVASAVTSAADYSVRAVRTSFDELGDLIDCFNGMLGQIQERDRELAEHRTHLEEEVAQRTQQLTIMNTDLAAAVTRAEAGSRAKTAFLANMSHEIRTPMTAILGYADILLEPQRTPSDRHDSLQVIRRNARHLMDLINDILDVSKIEADKMSVEKVRFDFPALIADVVSMTRPRAIDKGVEFKVNFTGLIPRQVDGDPVRLKQVLLNVLGNALKFTEHGLISLSVGCELLPGKSRLRFDVSDTGVGLAPEQIERLFKPFTQADESTTRKYGGTGLGLVISKKLVELMGGDITVVSQLGRGTTFTIFVEDGSLEGIEMLANLNHAVLQTDTPEESDGPLRLKGRILLAEDGQDNQCLISMFLREAGAEVVIAENGRVAVELATCQTFDLIFMDMQMPELDGYGATSRLRQLGMTLPIVALTAHALAEDRDKCLSAGCTDYCTKPIDRLRLVRMARRYLLDSPVDATSKERDLSPIRSEAINTAGMAQAVSDFVGRLPARVQSLQDQLNVRSLEELRRTLHQLKGAGSGYGFPKITELAAKAETFVKSGSPLQEISDGVQELIDLIERIEGYQPQKLMEGTCPTRS